MRTAILKSMSIALSLLLAGGAHAQVKLAVAGPVTGANAAFGAQLTQGVQQAAEDINKSGGILGQKIQVEVVDDVSDPKQGCRSPTSWWAMASSSWSATSTPA
jgi:branched-chain amino acid transport system substrate-binding protein